MILSAFLLLVTSGQFNGNLVPEVRRSVLEYSINRQFPLKHAGVPQMKDSIKTSLSYAGFLHKRKRCKDTYESDEDLVEETVDEVLS